MRAFGRTLLMAFFMISVSLSGCFGNEEKVDEDMDEFDEFGGYSVVAPIDTGINVYHNHFAMNGTYPGWLLEGLGVTMWCNLTDTGTWSERYEADRELCWDVILSLIHI